MAITTVTDVTTAEGFVRRYYREDRAAGRGLDVLARLIATAERDVEQDGYTVISRHDSVLGRAVWFSPGKRIVQLAPSTR